MIEALLFGIVLGMIPVTLPIWAFRNSLPSVPSWRSIKSLDLFIHTGIPCAK